jgi:hypothetical protein
MDNTSPAFDAQPCFLHLYDSQKDSDKKERRKATPKSSKFSKLPWDKIELLNEEWENSEDTSLMWDIISKGEWTEFVNILQEYPEMAHMRSEDGRGPMWWAHEYGRPRMVDVLRQLGVSELRSDAKGVKPTDISTLPKQTN